MAAFVADASVTLAWCFEDEATAWSDSLLDGLRTGNIIVVPAHWPTEISNGLLMAVRRGRIRPGRAELFWDEMAILPIEVEPPLSPRQAKLVLTLSQELQLTVYDAAYLELAQRKHLPFATLDSQLIAAAAPVGVRLLQS